MHTSILAQISDSFVNSRTDCSFVLESFWRWFILGDSFLILSRGDSSFLVILVSNTRILWSISISFVCMSVHVCLISCDMLHMLALFIVPWLSTKRYEDFGGNLDFENGSEWSIWTENAEYADVYLQFRNPSQQEVSFNECWQLPLFNSATSMPFTDPYFVFQQL